MNTSEQINPATEEFSYGNKVYNTKTKQSGRVVATKGTIVRVCYHDLTSGKLSDTAVSTSMQDLINESK